MYMYIYIYIHIYIYIYIYIGSAAKAAERARPNAWVVHPRPISGLDRPTLYMLV